MKLFAAALLGASLLTFAKPADASIVWYVVAAYGAPHPTAGPFSSATDCNDAANGYAARRGANPGYHCEYRDSGGAAGTVPVYRTLYDVVYHMSSHDRVVSDAFTSYAACSLEASHDNDVNEDFRYGCIIAAPEQH